jgi:adenosylmethionine-8-amino-7-oxononanoate aminotransferase
MSVSEESIFTAAFSPLTFPVVRAAAPHCYRCPLGLERATCGIACSDDLDAQLRQHADTVAAVVVEPMLQGAGGMVMWPAEFLTRVRQICDRHGVLLIADEVLTGFGRTGRMFACEHANVTPDIICLSKALTAGYLPLAATCVTDDVYDAFLSDDRNRTFFHGHSFTANPLACAVALASLDLLVSGGLLDRVTRLEAQFRRLFEPLRALACVGDVRVLGGVVAIELAAGGASGGGYLDAVGPRLAAAFLERGVLLRPLGHVLYVMPPYVITDDEVAWVADQVSDVLNLL